jgi:hypothetical protein
MLGAAVAWIADCILTRRAGGATPPPVEASVVVDAPIEQVWRELANIEGQPRWMRDMKAVRIDGPGEIGVGTRAEADVRIFGVQVRDPITITVFERPRHFGIRHEGRFSGSGDIRLEANADGSSSLVTWSETLVSPWLPSLGASILTPVLRRVFQADLERLRDLVESGPHGT